MFVIYNLGILLFNAVLRIVSLFNPKARKLVQGRNESMQRIKDLKLEEETIWVHCASLGEFEQGRPIIETIKRNKPNQKIVLTFFSPSGYEIRKNYELVDEVFYLPSDRPTNVRKFINAIAPKDVIFVKYEFWYNFLRILHSQGINTYIVSAIFRPQHSFFKWYGGWYRKMLGYFTKMYVQDEESGKLLSQIGINNFQVTGDTRFDRVYEIAQKSKEYPELAEFAKGSQVIVGGSTWPKGEKMIANYLNHNSNIKVLLAPHEIHNEHIQELKELFSRFNYACYTELEGVNLAEVRVLIVNTMGMLSSMYRYGDVAYIGGGFGSGIHNTLEASTFGLPVVFGPNYKKYQEACDLIQLGGGFEVSNDIELKAVFDRLLECKESLQKSSESAVNYVNKMRGATEAITAELF